ncbi:MAG: GTP cyclohydrolase I FolE2 [Gammaproteobacteria bacterium]|nr:GTP cyclohydrolase I FolE2 [Gammaproteobacteria bacterium]MBQ0839372.1 GTP cyclohydrolase I FolE2 [Gammaproteobacteria bacterium]
MQAVKVLPDIAKTRTETANYPLQWVGMENIAVPLTLNVGGGKQQSVTAKANVYVSLDEATEKGIHMSRLHAILNQLATQVCDKAGLDLLLKNMVTSQEGISRNAKLDLTFDLLLPKTSLLSNETGYQTYPIEIQSELLYDKHDYGLKLTIPYSSTCPCSAALSRQLVANAIDNEFSTSSIDKQALLSWAHTATVATPHSQRSYAYLHLSLGNHHWPPLPSLIMQIEEAIGTPVQTMVKRTDEQEFARLNANNLMFCEDAARNIKALLEQSAWIKDYRFKVEHQESLHAHNAVVIDQKYNP